MRERVVRDDQHGTVTGYSNRCRCTPCRAAWTTYQRNKRRRDPELAEYCRVEARKYYKANRRQVLERQATWYAANVEYVREAERKRRARVKAESLGVSRRWIKWEPHEDALLARISSSIAAASTLGRTVGAVHARRSTLRKKGLLT